MSHETPELAAARRIAEDVGSILGRSPSFRQLSVERQESILRDLATVRRGLGGAGSPAADPYALALETPFDRLRRGPASPPPPVETPVGTDPGTAPTGPRRAATETLAARAGALQDEIDFPAFVAGLVHSTFDAVVDASIRQMETFADLVGAVAKSVDRFTEENITPNQVRDWLSERHAADLALEVPRPGEAGSPKLHPRPTADEDGSDRSPSWLAEYGLAGQTLSDELVEEELVPRARAKLGESRLQTLATMVLMGMNRINVRDGTISAKVRFRAAAQDRARVDYAVASDPGAQPGWGERGSSAYSAPATMVSTVGVNVQSDTDLKAELFGEVKLNFVSETLPLDRFLDLAALQIVQGNARVQNTAPVGVPAAPVAPVPPQLVTPVPVAAPIAPAPVAAAPAPAPAPAPVVPAPAPAAPPPPVAV